MGPIRYFKQTILALGTPLSLLFSLTTIPLILPITIPLIFLALIVLLILVLLALLLVLLVVLALLLRQLPQLLQSESNPPSSSATLRRASETLTTRDGHVRNTSSTHSITSKRKSSIDSRLQRVEGFRNRLGSCHKSGTGTDMDSGIAHGYPTEYYPVSGFINANGQGTESTATFGIDSPRKKRFT